jgi:hypothetical protein
VDSGLVVGHSGKYVFAQNIFDAYQMLEKVAGGFNHRPFDPFI